jgi:hypothetical protein
MKSRWRGGLHQAALDVRVLHARMGKMPMLRGNPCAQRCTIAQRDLRQSPPNSKTFAAVFRDFAETRDRLCAHGFTFAHAQRVQVDARVAPMGCPLYERGVCDGRARWTGQTSENFPKLPILGRNRDFLSPGFGLAAASLRCILQRRTKRTQSKRSEIVASELETRKCSIAPRAPATERTQRTAPRARIFTLRGRTCGRLPSTASSPDRQSPYRPRGRRPSSPA